MVVDYGFHLSPAQSYTLLFLLFLAVFAFVCLIAYIDQTIPVARDNFKIAGWKGVVDAIFGVALLKVDEERLIEVLPNKEGFGYTATIFDGEKNRKILTITTNDDTGNPEYDEAVRLGGDDKQLTFNLLPEGRVKNRWRIVDERTTELNYMLSVYVKTDTPLYVEEAIRQFFRYEYLRKFRITSEKAKILTAKKPKSFWEIDFTYRAI